MSRILTSSATLHPFVNVTHVYEDVVHVTAPNKNVEILAGIVEEQDPQRMRLTRMERANCEEWARLWPRARCRFGVRAEGTYRVDHGLGLGCLDSLVDPPNQRVPPFGSMPIAASNSLALPKVQLVVVVDEEDDLGLGLGSALYTATPPPSTALLTKGPALGDHLDDTQRDDFDLLGDLDKLILLNLRRPVHRDGTWDMRLESNVKELALGDWARGRILCGAWAPADVYSGDLRHQLRPLLPTPLTVNAPPTTHTGPPAPSPPTFALAEAVHAAHMRQLIMNIVLPRSAALSSVSLPSLCSICGPCHACHAHVARGPGA
ncbi:hypothetical protein B0H11DRAFT_1900558 [Mycena galericulata]|nr:hypothetical protein B0H11DRAFT_1900558 [Mycena galericulata]